MVHRLDNLRRSGRIGGAAAWLGTALSLKPLLRIDVDGRLVLAQRVRTATKARRGDARPGRGVVGDEAAVVAVHHVADPDAADEVADALAERLPACAPAIVTDLGPGAGAARGRRRGRRRGAVADATGSPTPAARGLSAAKVHRR